MSLSQPQVSFLSLTIPPSHFSPRLTPDATSRSILAHMPTGECTPSTRPRTRSSAPQSAVKVSTQSVLLVLKKKCWPRMDYIYINSHWFCLFWTRPRRHTLTYFLGGQHRIWLCSFCNPGTRLVTCSNAGRCWVPTKSTLIPILHR